MALETCPKKAEETLACRGFAKAYSRSKVTRVEFGVAAREASNLQIVDSVSNKGVEEEATASTDEFGIHVTVLT